MYTYPTHISDGFLKAITDNPKAVKYLDMPLQHASRNVLKAMKRGGTRDSLERLVKRVREAVPEIAIRTTFLVGYPGETAEDFEELMTFVKNCEFDNVGVFTYSDEEGTPAYELPDKVDPEVAQERHDRLMEEQIKISKHKNEAKVGETYNVMFEGVSEESELLWKGRLEGQAQEIDGHVLINDAPEDFLPISGKLVKVKITEAHDYDLVGEVVRF
jgi:ribosomal protein S12 methylthiotransferase